MDISNLLSNRRNNQPVAFDSPDMNYTPISSPNLATLSPATLAESTRSARRESSIISTDPDSETDVFFDGNERYSLDSDFSDRPEFRVIGPNSVEGEGSNEGSGETEHESEDTIHDFGRFTTPRATQKEREPRTRVATNSTVGSMFSVETPALRSQEVLLSLSLANETSPTSNSLVPSSPTPSQQTFSTNSSTTPTAAQFPHIPSRPKSSASTAEEDFSDLDRRLQEDEELLRVRDRDDEEALSRKKSFLGPRMRIVSPAPWDNSDEDIEAEPVRVRKDSTKNGKKSFEIAALIEKERERKLKATTTSAGGLATSAAMTTSTSTSTITSVQSSNTLTSAPTRKLPRPPQEFDKDSSFLDFSDAKEATAVRKIKKSTSSTSSGSISSVVREPRANEAREHKRSFTSASTKSFASISSKTSADLLSNPTPRMPSRQGSSLYLHEGRNDSSSSIPGLSGDDSDRRSPRMKRKSSASTLTNISLSKSKSTSPRRRSNTVVSSSSIPLDDEVVPPLPSPGHPGLGRNNSVPDAGVGNGLPTTISSRSTTFEIVAPGTSIVPPSLPRSLSSSRNIHKLQLHVPSPNGDTIAENFSSKSNGFLDKPPPSPITPSNARLSSAPKSAPANITAFKNVALAPLRTKDLQNDALKEKEVSPSPQSAVSTSKRRIAGGIDKDSIKPPTPGPSAAFN
ncbi:hypothetical protein BT69DRAFT_1131472, partial [Atractiella rhizophila]